MSAVDADKPIYGPFFGVMGAASAIIFSGKCDSLSPSAKKWTEKKNDSLDKMKNEAKKKHTETCMYLELREREREIQRTRARIEEKNTLGTNNMYWKFVVRKQSQCISV